MNLDELQTAQSRERQTDSLQQLRESFYEDAGRFIGQLREERERAAERADDPFDAPEVRRLTDDIKTAERTVEAIYERRIGKLVKQASLEAAGMAADASGLTREEQDAFETLVSTIESNRVRVLDEVVAGDAVDSPADPELATESEDGDADGRVSAADSGADPTPDGTPPGDRDATPDVDAADLMGGTGASDDGPDAASPGRDDARGSADADSDSDAGPAVPPDTPPDGVSADPPVEARGDGPVTGPEDASDTAAGSPVRDAPGDGDSAASDPEEESTDVDRTTVRITRDVGEILGVDQRAYDLKSEDVVTLPTPNADPLVARDAAERLD